MLLVVQTAFLGDIVLTIPLLRELRRARPGQRVVLVTTRAGAGLLAGQPFVDELLAVDKRWTRPGLRSYREVLRRLRRERIDVAVAAQRSMRTGQLIRLSGARLRVGFAGAAGAWAYQRRVEWDGKKHAVLRYLDLAGPAGGDPSTADPQPRLVVDPCARTNVESLLRREGVDPAAGTLCLAPGSERETKRWTSEGFAAVIDAAAERGLVPLLVGSVAERELCRDVARRARVRARVLAGRTGVRELVALLARARLLVGNDSGAAHLASAVGTPVVSIFGPTSPIDGYRAFGSGTRVVQRDGLDCRPCSRRGPRACPEGHFRCMREIRPASVVEALDGLLARPQVSVLPG